MRVTLDVAKSTLGWEITYDGCFAAEARTTVYATQRAALDACELERADMGDWERAGAHVDGAWRDAY